MVLCLALLLAAAAPAAGQPATPPAEPDAAAPAIRRWLDVQQVTAGSRFRWFKNSDEQLRSSQLQWQTQLRARFRIDKAGRYNISTFASTGSSFVSSWNNTGAGLGNYQGPFNLKQLFFAAEPVSGLQFEVGGLHVNRGEMAEHLTYDNDAFIVGERVSYRPAKKRLTQVSVTTGFFGGSDYADVSVFKRLDRMNDFNYGQALVAFALHPRLAASVDYTYEDGRDIFRQGVNLRMPSTAAPLTLLKAEAYQRVGNDDGYGFNVSGDFRYRRYSLTAGVMSVDEFYGSPSRTPYNADRYENGTRQYTIHTVQLTPELSFTIFQTEAFATDFPINLQHRFDALVNFNATSLLKRAGIF
jgi:hypothetical protein